MEDLDNLSVYGIRSGDIDVIAQMLANELTLTKPAYFEIYKNSCEDEEGKYLRKPKYPAYSIFITVYDTPDWKPVDKILTGNPRIGATLLERWSKDRGEEI